MLKFHHKALAAGYIKKNTTVEKDYCGRFGRGKVIYRNNPLSTRYCIVEYWLV